MNISPAIRDRINSAADTLYQEGGRRSFPTVDAVRKLARVNMNDASTGMKAWRRAQTTHSDRPLIQVPIALQQTHIAALNAIWAEAVDLANEQLVSAQADWEAERAESEALSEQIANAYEAQAIELAKIAANVAQIEQEKRALAEAVEVSQRALEDAYRQIASSCAATREAEVRADEVARGAGDLRLALDRAHAYQVKASEEHAAQLQSHASEMATLRAELLDLRRSLLSTEAAAQAKLREALDEAASLRGKLAAINEIKQAAGATGPGGAHALHAEKQD